MAPTIRKSNPGSLKYHRFRKRDEHELFLAHPKIFESTDTTQNLNGLNATTETPPERLVKTEEVCIVLLLLFLWVGAIALFFNRWGKIRMLEPYQPKFCEAHRVSCPIVTEVTPLQHFPRTFSKFNLSGTGDGSPYFAKCKAYHGIPLGNGGVSGGFLTTPAILASRPRQNSVFVTSAHSQANSLSSQIRFKNATRKAKSAIDLSTLVLSEEFFESVRRNSKNSVTHL